MTPRTARTLKKSRYALFVCERIPDGLFSDSLFNAEESVGINFCLVIKAFFVAGGTKVDLAIHIGIFVRAALFTNIALLGAAGSKYSRYAQSGKQADNRFFHGK